MDQVPLVDPQINEGRRLIEKFVAEGAPVRAAFWGREEEREDWTLYLVSDLVDSLGSQAAYKVLDTAGAKIGVSWVSTSDATLIGAHDRLAQEVAKMMADYPHKFGGVVACYFRGVKSLQYIYVYPPHLFTFRQANPMTSEQIGQEILKLMNRTAGTHTPARVNLKDGTAFDGVPFSVQLGTQQSVVVQFIADREVAPRVVRLDEIASIA